MIRTLDTLRDFLSYDPETGIFTWLRAPRRGVAPGSVAGSPDNLGYIKIRWGTISYKAHALAWWFVHGEMPDGPLDHINGTPADNRIANLRRVTISQNQMNRRPKKNGTSRFKGVTLRKDYGDWCAHIRFAGKSTNLGIYGDESEAAKAYDAAAYKMFGVFARLNFPEDYVNGPPDNLTFPSRRLLKTWASHKQREKEKAA
jgi:hypothetical protein